MLHDNFWLSNSHRFLLLHMEIADKMESFPFVELPELYHIVRMWMLDRILFSFKPRYRIASKKYKFPRHRPVRYISGISKDTRTWLCAAKL